MMAQVQQGQNLWRAPWGNYDDTCEETDGLAYIQVLAGPHNQKERISDHTL